MKSLFLFAMLIVLAGLIPAQTIRIENSFNAKGSLQVKKLYTPDTVLIRTDTVYLLNRPLYLLYSSMQGKQANCQTLLRQTIAMYEERISQQDSDYNRLNAQFPLLQKQFENYRYNAVTHIDSLSFLVSDAENHLKQAREENEKAQAQLNRLARRSTTQKITFGLGGVTVGLIIALLLK